MYYVYHGTSRLYVYIYVSFFKYPEMHTMGLRQPASNVN